MKIKLSWFQKVVLAYFVVIGFVSGYIQYADIASSIGYSVGLGIVILVPMLLFNKYVVPILKIKNKALIKGWFVVKIIITALVILWVILFVAG